MDISDPLSVAVDSFIGTQPRPFIYLRSVAALTFQWHSWGQRPAAPCCVEAITAQEQAVLSTRVEFSLDIESNQDYRYVVTRLSLSIYFSFQSKCDSLEMK